ncbi:DUF6247 family protein [Sphaerisporangium sp. NPDC051017]|uniref:DUF6247 family protein n=1 Tax=Sphaerisporangium sp. NPDC051017 TaxID=3154636 RepID=UPI0034430BCD
MNAEHYESSVTRTPEQIVKSLDRDRSPRNIRACLPHADRTYFDKDFRQAMAKATEELDLGPVNELLAHWWHMARMKASGEYEDLLEQAARLQDQIECGEYIPGRPLQEVIAERAAELGVRLNR